jgi:hypothetical protein
MRTLMLVQLVLGVVSIFVPIFVLLLVPAYFTEPMIWSPIWGVFAILVVYLHVQMGDV